MNADSTPRTYVLDSLLQPTLNGSVLQLRPLSENDFESLYLAASDPLIWEQHPQPNRHERSVFQEFFDGAIRSKGALTILDKSSQQIIGSSRFYDFDPETKSVTIGYTFLARKYWGGVFNRELKNLMIGHAFQFADTIQFHIGEKNIRSQMAIAKTGAVLKEKRSLGGHDHLIYAINIENWHFNSRRQKIEPL